MKQRAIPCLNVAAVAAEFGPSPAFVRRAIRSGRLPAYRTTTGYAVIENNLADRMIRLMVDPITPRQMMVSTDGLFS